MIQEVSSLAGIPTPKFVFVDVARHLAAYTDLKPNPGMTAQRVAFGTSVHHSVSFERFDGWPVPAITQILCDHCWGKEIDRPLLLGIGNQVLSKLVFDSKLEQFVEEGVQTMITDFGEFTPTSVISNALLVHNRGLTSKLAVGNGSMPSYSPSAIGGFKYKPPNGGTASIGSTTWLQSRVKALIYGNLKDVKRHPLAHARQVLTMPVPNPFNTRLTMDGVAAAIPRTGWYTT